MQVDLQAHGVSVEQLPRFQQAVFHQRRLTRMAIGLFALALIGLLAACFIGLFTPLSLWLPMLVNQASALLMLVAGLQSAGWVLSLIHI